MGKIGFVLEGGGVRGAYQAGAMKALYEKGIEPDVITGTSIGAINGAMVSLGKLDRLIELYENFEADRFFNLDPEIAESLKLDEELAKQVPQITRAVSGLLAQGGVDIEPLREMMEREIGERELRESPIELGIVTMEIPRIKPVEIFVDSMPPGRVQEYILASAYLPFFKVEKRNYIDGWFVDNMPLDLLRSRGEFERIYIIRSHRGLPIRRAWLEEGVTLISPSRKVGRSFNLSQDRMRDNIQMGYYDTLRILEGYAGEHFCLEDFPSLVEELIDREVTLKLFRQFSTGDSYDPDRYVYEELVPGLARSLGLGVESSYQEIFLSLLEEGGNYLELDLNRVYDFPSFMTSLRRALDLENYKWSLKERVSSGVARYTRGWLGDKESLVLALLDILLGDKWR